MYYYVVNPWVGHQTKVLGPRTGSLMLYICEAARFFLSSWYYLKANNRQRQLTVGNISKHWDNELLDQLFNLY